MEIDRDAIVGSAVESNLLTWGYEQKSIRFYHQLVQEYFQNCTRSSLQSLLLQRLEPYGCELSAKASISSAFRIALSAHRGRSRVSGEDFIYHLVAVALIVTRSIGKFDETLVAAALVHDVKADNENLYKTVEKVLGKEVFSLAEGMHKLKQLITPSLENKEARDLTIERVKSLDSRIILLKLADRLHNIQTLSFLPRIKQEIKINETINYYLPLAKSFGYLELGEQLEKALYALMRQTLN